MVRLVTLSYDYEAQMILSTDTFGPCCTSPTSMRKLATHASRSWIGRHVDREAHYARYAVLIESNLNPIKRQIAS